MPVEVPSRSPGGLRKLWLGLGAAVLVGAGALGWSYLPGTGAAGAGSSDPFATWPLPVTIGDKCGAIDQTGKLVINPAYDGLSPSMGEGLAAFRQNGNFGFIDAAGAIVVNPQFKRALPPVFKGQDLGVAQIGELWGYVDKTGKIAINPQFEAAHSFDERGTAWVRSGGLFGLIDRQGKYLINPQFKSVGDFIGDLAAVEQAGKWGLVDRSGKIVVTPQFDGMMRHISPGGLWVVQIGERWGLADSAGKLVVAPTYRRINALADDELIPVEADYSTWGFIDRTGKMVIAPAYEQVGHFFGGSLAPVKLPGGKWGYIDKTGKLAINPQFDRAREFIDGLAIVELADRFGMIGTDGTFKVQPQYSRLEVLRYYERDGLADYRPVIKARDANRRWGLLDGKGQVLVAPQFDEINCPLNSRGSSD